MKPNKYRTFLKILVAVVIATGGFIAVTRFTSDGPIVRGKSVGAWVDSIELGGRDPTPARLAKSTPVQAVLSLGSNAVPALIRCFQLRPRRFLLGPPFLKVQQILAARFPNVVPLPPNTPPTGPELSRITSAAAILLLLGPEQGGGIQTVIRAIRTNDFSVLRAAASGAMFVADNVPNLGLEVILSLHDPSPAAREFACMSLRYVPGSRSAAIPILTNLIYDTQGAVAFLAVEALRLMASSHKDTLPALLSALTNSNSSTALRSQILGELYLFNSLPPAVAPALQRLTNDPLPQIAALALRALSNVRTNPPPLKP